MQREVLDVPRSGANEDCHRVMWTVVVVIWFSVTVHLVDAADKCGLTELPQISDTNAFLNDKEDLVQRIAGFALQNYRNRSTLVAICNNSTVCSRGVCRPLLRDLKENALTCESIPSNPDCVGRGNKTCTTALLSRDQAYIRLSPKVGLASNFDCNIASTICTQQGLDNQIFKSTSNEQGGSLTLEAYIYFGANNGVWRLYPGKELNDTACNGPDSRKRPWYVGATALQKDVVVLLDNGSSMGKSLSASTGSETIFNASRSVTLELLDTLSPGDQLSVFTFASSSSLIGQVTVNSALNSVNDPGVFPLKDNVSSIPDPSYTGALVNANLTAGLLAALDQFDDSDNTTLKAIIIITSGEISGEDLSLSLIGNLTGQNVRVFIYRFLGYGDVQPASTTLQSISCTLQGWYEEGFYSDVNPLETLQSFYSYVAKLRFDQPSQTMPYWVPTYLSSSGLGSVITTAYPVFDNKTLVGVAGVDILLNSFLLTASDSQMILQGRNTLNTVFLGGQPAPIDCGQKLNPPGDSSCPASGVNGFCTSDIDNNPDKVATLKERVCCKDCCPWKSDDGLSPGEVAGVVIGSAIGGIILGVLCCCLICKVCIEREPTVPGDQQSYTATAGPPKPDSPPAGYFDKQM